MNELDVAKYALKAMSLCNNNPDTDRRACNFAVEKMMKLQQQNHITLDSPARVLWKITGKCNSKCLHCWAALGDKHSGKDLIKVAKELCDLNVMMVSLSGGEPFLCKELFDIIRILKQKNIIIEIMSNGTLINENTAEQLSSVLDLNTDAIQISLDGSCAEIHDKQRNANLFNATINGIKCLRNCGINVRVAFCATCINQKDIYNTYKLAIQLGVQTFSIVPVFNFRNAENLDALDSKLYLEEIIKCKSLEDESNTKLRLHADQYYQYLLNENYEQLDISNLLNDSQPYEYKLYLTETNSSIQIDAHGEVVPGPEWDIDVSGGNVYKLGMKKIWKDGLNWEMFRKGRNLKGTKCEKCKVYPFCLGGNAKYAYNRYGLIDMPDATCLINL